MTVSKTSMVRIVQWGLAAIALAISGKLTSDNTSLSSIASDLNDLNSSNSSTSSTLSSLTKRYAYLNKEILSEGNYSEEENNYNGSGYLQLLKREDDDDDTDSSSNITLASSLKSSAISLSSGSLSVFSIPTLSFLPKSFTENYVKAFSITSTSTSTSSSLTKTDYSYMGGLAVSEVGAHVLFFASFVYQVAEYGAMDCTSIESLLQNYNVTNDDSEDLSDFFNYLESSSNDTSSDDDIISSIFSGYSNSSTSSSASLSGLSTNNLTTTETEAKLLIQLASNCQLKKASIGICFVVWVAYIITTSSVSYSGYSLYKSYKSSKSSSGDNKTTEPKTGSSAAAKNLDSNNTDHKNNFSTRESPSKATPTSSGTKDVVDTGKNNQFRLIYNKTGVFSSHGSNNASSTTIDNDQSKNDFPVEPKKKTQYRLVYNRSVTFPKIESYEVDDDEDPSMEKLDV
ncbi:hypothetical protein PACTADRAFT_32405 [Pachysolen tannophilus NRRL Y-2460]|uniref:Uncharacterized protein n=1 Tax=Pachysolen tannophilus NRRL Y-2460 TaxID=669874 RepID=A0A1E4TYT9_PACTA|nr:hypothetical protein PACTADRAFT_32405 [Pachysolen tannophilus NRRL Y-2460]